MADGRQPHRCRRRRAAHRSGSRRHPRRERDRRGIPRRDPDDRDRRRHPPRPQPRLPAPRHGPARPARAHHQGALAHRAPCRRDPRDPRGLPRGDERRARTRLRRDPGQPAADAGRCRRQACVRARRTRGIARTTAADIARAAKSLREAKHPGIFCGWGAVDATAELIAIAELLGAPVTTTLQGLSAFPGNHRLHAGFALGQAARARGQRMRFATATACSPSARALPRSRPGATAGNRRRTWSTWTSIRASSARTTSPPSRSRAMRASCWAFCAMRSGRPPRRTRRRRRGGDREGQARLPRGMARTRFEGPREPAALLRRASRPASDDGIVVADDGNHTFLVAELMPIHAPRTYFSPSDFNSMGYCIPATIGAKLARPERAGRRHRRRRCGAHDGASRCRRRSRRDAGVAWFVFNDGELAQIAQAQETPYNRKTCTVLPRARLRGLAPGEPRRVPPDAGRCRRRTRRSPRRLPRRRGRQAVLVDVRIDYSKRTRFTEGVIRTNLKRFGIKDQARIVGRALWRRP